VSAPVRWYEAGFAHGAAGGRETQRKGRPRRSAMVDHWKRGVRDGAFALRAFSHAFAADHARGTLRAFP